MALRERFLILLLQLGESFEGEGVFERANEYYRRLYAAEPIREDACRGLMRCLARMGRPREALGIFEDSEYTENSVDIRPGQIIIIGTDGIRESMNTDGAMFGSGRLEEVVRKYAISSAESIAAKVFDAVAEFRHPLDPEDDITLVIVKILPDQ